MLAAVVAPRHEARPLVAALRRTPCRLVCGDPLRAKPTLAAHAACIPAGPLRRTAPAPQCCRAAPRAHLPSTAAETRSPGPMMEASTSNHCLPPWRGSNMRAARAHGENQEHGKRPGRGVSRRRGRGRRCGGTAALARPFEGVLMCCAHHRGQHGLTAPYEMRIVINRQQNHPQPAAGLAICFWRFAAVGGQKPPRRLIHSSAVARLHTGECVPCHLRACATRALMRAHASTSCPRCPPRDTPATRPHRHGSPLTHQIVAQACVGCLPAACQPDSCPAPRPHIRAHAPRDAPRGRAGRAPRGAARAAGHAAGRPRAGARALPQRDAVVRHLVCGAPAPYTSWWVARQMPPPTARYHTRAPSRTRAVSSGCPSFLPHTPGPLLPPEPPPRPQLLPQPTPPTPSPPLPLRPPRARRPGDVWVPPLRPAVAQAQGAAAASAALWYRHLHVHSPHPGGWRVVVTPSALSRLQAAWRGGASRLQTEW